MSASAARRAPLALGALALILTLILVGAPQLLGTTAEAVYRQSLAETLVSLPPGWGLVEHYQRGWFDSRATAELTPPPGSPLGGRIHLESRIGHGPWSWFGPGPWPALARIDTRADWEGGALTLPPLRLATVIGVGGAGETRLSVPAADPPAGADGRRLRNEAIDGVLRFHRDTREVVVDLSVPGLTLLDASGPLASLREARLAGTLTGWRAGRYAGRAELKIAAASAGTAPGGGEAPLILDGFRMTLEQHATAPATAGSDSAAGTPTGADPVPAGTRLDLRLDGAADRLRLDAADYRSVVLGLNARSLDLEALTALTDALRTLASDQVPPAMRGLAGAAIATQLLPRFLATGPSIVLDPVALVTPDGPASARLALAADGQSAVAQGPAAVLGALLGGNRDGLLRGVQGDAALDLPEAVARGWAKGAGPAALDVLQGWTQAGWVTVRDGRLTSSLRLAHGRLSINGRPLVLRLPGLGR